MLPQLVGNLKPELIATLADSASKIINTIEEKKSGTKNIMQFSYYWNSNSKKTNYLYPPYRFHLKNQVSRNGNSAYVSCTQIIERLLFQINLKADKESLEGIKYTGASPRQ